MLALLTSPNIECDECGFDAVHVLVNRSDCGFAVQLCPLHLSLFLQRYLDSPDDACTALSRKRMVEADQ